jgi:hypothetical protein
VPADPIALIHLPRTGGNSLREAAAAKLGRRMFYLKAAGDVLPEHVSQIPEDVSLIMGHMNHGLHRYRPVRYATVLRDPIQRALSDYQLWRVRRASRDQSAPFDGPDTIGRPYIRKERADNVQTRMLAGVYLAEAMICAMDALELVKRNLEAFHLVGFTADLPGVARSLGLETPPRLNRYVRDFELTPSQMGALWDQNRADLALFDWALKRFGGHDLYQIEPETFHETPEVN